MAENTSTPETLATPEDFLKQKNSRFTKIALIASGVVAALLLVVVFSFPFRDQIFLMLFGRIPGEAWLTQQSAAAFCAENGSAGLSVTFHNTEPSKPVWCMKVVATDQQSGLKVDLGKVNPGQTVTEEIDLGIGETSDGRVKFDLSWCDGHKGVDTRYANYEAINCGAPTATPTPPGGIQCYDDDDGGPPKNLNNPEPCDDNTCWCANPSDIENGRRCSKSECEGATPTPTLTPTLTPSPTVSITSTPGPTSTPTSTPKPQSTPTPTLTGTPVPSATATLTPTGTLQPSSTPTATSVPTSTATATPTPTPTPTPKPIGVPDLPTATPKPTSTPTPLVTSLPESGTSSLSLIFLVTSLLLGGLGSVSLIRGWK